MKRVNGSWWLTSLIFAMFIMAAPSAARAQTPAPCCVVTAIDPKTGVATAKVDANSEVFEFKLTNPKLLAELRVGQGVYANFKAHQVSLDGKTIAGPIINGPQAPASAPAERAPAAAQQPASPTPTATSRAGTSPRGVPPPGTAAQPRTLAGAAGNGARSSVGQLPVITISAGAAQRTPTSSTFNANRSRVEARTLTATLNGKSASAHITRIHGLDGIQQAQGLPDGVKELLLMHVKTLGAGESDGYIVNTDLAAEWARTHPVSATVKKAAQDTDSHTGCKSFSMHCAGEAEKHAEGQASELVKQAKDDWNHAATQLGHDWDVAADKIEACFADTRTNPVDLPVEFSLSLPSLITLDSSDVNAIENAISVINQINSGQTNSGSGSASSILGSAASAGAISGAATGAGYGDGAVGAPGAIAGAVKGVDSKQQAANAAKDSPWSSTFKGKVVFGFPVLSSSGTVIRADFFYIPCLPFLLRPRSVVVSGSLAVEAALTGNAQVSGQYNKTIPLPTADLHIPIQVWPIVLPDGTPIAELDLSLFVQGFLQITGKGQISTNLNLDYAHLTGFDFTCDGKGCSQNSLPRSQLTKLPSAPETTPNTTSTIVSGEIEVQPKLFTGLEINVDVDIIQARVGPEATMEGDVQGDACLSTNGSSRSTSDALLAELGWTPGMRADLLIFNKAIGDGYDHPLEQERLMAFHDLLQERGGSNALTPAVSGQAKLAPGQSAIYNIKMPACYPYTQPVTYHVAWTGGVTPGVNSPGPTAGSKACTPPAKAEAGDPPSEMTCVFDPKQALALSFSWPQASATDYNITVAALGDQLGRKFTSAKPADVHVSVAAK